jgi:FtsZ-interacting cell division protein ZipA
MTQWCESKAFREDYEKRILASLNSRLLTRDGRMRNPDEKPIFIESQAPVPAPEPEPIAVKLPAKQAKEVPSPLADEAPKVEGRSKGSLKSLKAKAALDADDDYEVEPPKEKAKPTAADVAKLKEIKRQEEIEKNKLALERKKKQAEKQAAKAAARAQKEAEKKLKVLHIYVSCLSVCLFLSRNHAIYTITKPQLILFRKRRRKPRRNLEQLTLMSLLNRTPSLMKPWKPRLRKKQPQLRLH